MQRFWLACAVLLPVLGVAVNASVPEINLVAAFEVSDKQENEVVHRLGEDPLVVRGMKKLPHPDHVLTLVNRTMGSPDADWVHRAMLQYSEALKYWREGSELMVVEHLFMAAEVVSQVIVRRQQRLTGLDRPQLAASWGLDDVRRLESTARAAMVFRDKDLATKVRSVSDGLEHGYASFPQLQAEAAAARDEAARRVREAVLGLIELDPVTRRIFAEQKYEVPARADRVGLAFGGKLLGSTTGLTEQDVPMVEPGVDVLSFERMADSYRMKITNTATALLPTGMQLRIESLATSGPVESVGTASVE